MSFPYKLHKKLDFDKTDYWIEDLPSNFHQLFEGAIGNAGYKYEEDAFVSNNSLFNIPFKFDFETKISESKLTIKYTLHLQNLVNGIIVIILLSAFISRFEFGTFLWFSFAVSIAFYQLSLLIINTGIKNKIYKILSAYKKVKEESDIEYWVKESDRNCPACGAKLDNNTLFCPDCGLKIRQNAYTKPLNIMGIENNSKPENVENKKENTEIKYHLKKKDTDQ